MRADEMNRRTAALAVDSDRTSRRDAAVDLRVVDFDFRTDSRWEAFVDAHPQAMLFHHPAWLRVLERENGQRCVGLACLDSRDCVQGILPLFRTRGVPFGLAGRLGGSRLSSLPRTPVAGPLTLSRAAAAELVRAARDRVQAEPGRTLQIKALDADLDGLVDGVTGERWRTSYAVALPERRRLLGQPECLAEHGPCDTCRVLRFGNCDNHRHVTWAVKKARAQSVVTVEATTMAQLDEWYRIYLETMRRNFVPARSLDLFHAAWEILRAPGYMRLLLAAQQPSGRIIGGAVLLSFKTNVFAAFAASRERDLPLHPNDLLHWVAIHDACRAGARLYDFGEVPDDAPNLARFKRKWNCVETHLHRYHYPSAEKHSDRGGRPALKKIAAQIWGRTPLAATAIVGRLIYRYL